MNKKIVLENKNKEKNDFFHSKVNNKTAFPQVFFDFSDAFLRSILQMS